jgi:hypothetical protein
VHVPDLQRGAVSLDSGDSFAWDAVVRRATIERVHHEWRTTSVAMLICVHMVMSCLFEFRPANH